MMSKAWCEQHKVENAQDFNAKQETFAVRNANGTGPFMLDRYEPDVRTVLKANPRWWGRHDKRSAATSTRSIYSVIGSDATRLRGADLGRGRLRLDPAVPGPAAHQAATSR